VLEGFFEPGLAGSVLTGVVPGRTLCRRGRGFPGYQLHCGWREELTLAGLMFGADLGRALYAEPAVSQWTSRNGGAPG
jgi:hypothetical protein